nr:endonuclease III domain-containing protein [Methanococcus vannielii]
MKTLIFEIYKHLYAKYGPQGWWPILSVNSINLTKTGSVTRYHPNDYSYPKTRNQCFEICICAILTQNTVYTSVEKSIQNINELMEITPENMLNLDINLLKRAIKPSGYYNQKSEYLKIFSEFFIDCKLTPTRNELLSIKGIGPETADSMLLYGFKIPNFVVDAYTKRILLNLKLINENAKYNDIKELFENSLPKSLEIYQEYHALLVEHGKNYYKKKENYSKCPLLKII